MLVAAAAQHQFDCCCVSMVNISAVGAPPSGGSVPTATRASGLRNEGKHSWHSSIITHRNSKIERYYDQLLRCVFYYSVQLLNCEVNFRWRLGPATQRTSC